MAFTSDSQGFLVGETITEIKRQGDILSAIRNDISAIKKSVIKSSNSRVDSAQTTSSVAQQPAQRSRANVGNPDNQNRHLSNITRFISSRDSTAVTPGTNIASTPVTTVSNNQTAAVVPSPPVRLRDDLGRFRSAQQNHGEVSVPVRQSGSRPVLSVVHNAENAPTESSAPIVRRVSAAQENLSAVMPSRSRNRDNSENHTTGNPVVSEGSQSRLKSEQFNSLPGRIAAAVAQSGSGLQEVDPTVKAFNEVAEPLSRGYKLLVGDKGHSGESVWLRKIFSILNLSRTDNTTFDRAARRSLGHIEDNTAGGSDGDGGTSVIGTMGIGALIMRGLAAIGPLLVTAVTGVLSVVFSPIGLAIGAAAAVAWGLFTENGQKFFGEIGAKVIEGWNVVTTAFAPVSDAIRAGWEAVTVKFEPIIDSIGSSWDTVKTGFDSLIDGMVSSWNAFTGFLKDKFGIDVPAILKPIADAGKKAIEGAKTTYQNVKEGAKTVVNKVADKATSVASKVADKASTLGEKANTYVKEKTGVDVKEKSGNAIRAVKEGVDTVSSKAAQGASNIVSHATGKSAANKAALMAEMANSGITDPKEQAMLLAEVDHESMGFAKTKEDVRYKTADRLMGTSATARKKGRAAAEDAIAQGGDAAAEFMYGGRMGNTEKGDGAKYKGRGLIQLTGKSNYAAASKDLGVDLVNHPELAEDPQMAAKTAVWFWKKNNLGKTAKVGDVRGNRHKVNGGENGLADVGKKYNNYLADISSGGLKTDESINNKPVQVASINNSVTAQPITAQPAIAKSAPSPVLPEAPKQPTIVADATPIMEPLASLGDRKSISVSVEKGDVGQDLSDRRLAHISTGGLSGKG